ncbi:hypothetical protein A4X03_0g5757, partial [Tilletia caries]
HIKLFHSFAHSFASTVHEQHIYIPQTRIFLPRVVFLLPLSFLLLAAAVNSAPVPETNYPSCLDMPQPRTLEARFDVLKTDLARLLASKDHFEEVIANVRGQIQRITNGRTLAELSAEEDQLVLSLWDYTYEIGDIIEEIEQAIQSLQ